jgi:hypothetical protein
MLYSLFAPCSGNPLSLFAMEKLTVTDHQSTFPTTVETVVRMLHGMVPEV